ncbi:MAG: adenylyltransferase/cytidyltransferase family protein [Candidatus Binatia bacterium]
MSRGKLAAHLSESYPHGGKVVTGADLDALLAQWRKDGKRIVFTNGCFDVLHVGHVNYLRFAKSKGDVLIVGVNEDASVSRAKGPTRPVNPLADRMEMLAALEMVDAVTSFSEDARQADRTRDAARAREGQGLGREGRRRPRVGRVPRRRGAPRAAGAGSFDDQRILERARGQTAR